MYLDLYRESRNIVLSHLTTAQPVDEGTKLLVEKTIAEYTHKQVELVAKTDPEVLGGLAMEFDNNLYDATVATRLAKLRRRFEENVYESKL
jgi:F-type H+-transporting ATPase subunit delta